MLESALNRAERTLARVDTLDASFDVLQAASGIVSWVAMATETGPMDEQDEQEYAYEILSRCTDALLLIAD